jgi:sugar-specific transcriptional regulator TrmB
LEEFILNQSDQSDKPINGDAAHDILMELGLTLYKSKIYRSLYIIGPKPISDIAAHSGVPANKIYKLIDELQDEGFINEVIPVDSKTPKIYRAVEPDNFVKIVENKLSKLEEHLKHYKVRHSEKIVEDTDYLIIRNKDLLDIQINDIVKKSESKKLYYLSNNRTGDFVKNLYKTNKNLEYIPIEIKNSVQNNYASNRNALYILIDDYLISSLKSLEQSDEYLLIKSRSLIELQKQLLS